MRENAPSSTAYLIAASISCSVREPDLAPLVSSHAAALSSWVPADSLRSGRLLLRALARPWFRTFLRRMENLLLPGIQAHYLVRKRAIEEATRNALETDVRQVVVLGAGFDSLCWHLHTEYATCLFFEVDHPQTQRVKREVLERRVPLRPNLQFLPIDLTLTDLEAELRACPRFDPTLPTLFLMEGLTMYLSAEEMERLFRAFRSVGGPRPQVFFTFMEPQADGNVNFPHASPAVSWWLKYRGESFRWGIPREQLPTYLTSQGFQMMGLVDRDEFRRRYMTSPLQTELPLAEGEYLCIAIRQEERAAN